MILNRGIARRRITYTNYWIICSPLHSATVLSCRCHCCKTMAMSTSNQSIPNRTDTRRNYFLLIDHNFQSSSCHRCLLRPPARAHTLTTTRKRARRQARVAESTYHTIMMGTSVFIFIIFRSTNIAILYVVEEMLASRCAAQFKPIKEGFIK